jgi:hypothetical protein
MDVDESTVGNHDENGPERIPEEWLYRPHFHLWPSQWHSAVLWVLAKLIAFRTHKGRSLTTQDYHDFLQLSKWKFYQEHNRMSRVGNYLSVLET